VVEISLPNDQTDLTKITKKVTNKNNIMFKKLFQGLKKTNNLKCRNSDKMDNILERLILLWYFKQDNFVRFEQTFVLKTR